MTISIFVGTIKEKLFWLINMLGTLPLQEYIRRMELSYKTEYPEIESIEIKVVHVTGHHEVIKFDQTELQNIEILTKMKGKLTNMEKSKWRHVKSLREDLRKIKNLREEIKMMENME
jgi:hypothetical protein